MRESGMETTLLSTALQEAMSTLKAQERAMSARAAASEQLSAQVFDSLTAGLLVVDGEGRVKFLNPSAARMLAVEGQPAGVDYRVLLAGATPLVDVLAEGLSTQRPIVRRSVHVERDGRSWHFGVTVSPLADPASHAGRDLSLLRSDDDRRARTAASVERGVGTAWRADGRHRARVSQRPRDDSRLQPPHRSAGAARAVPAVCRRDPPGDGRARPRRDQFSQLRAARADLARARGPRVDGAPGGGRTSSRAAEGHRRSLSPARSAPCRATRCCCDRCSPI